MLLEIVNEQSLYGRTNALHTYSHTRWGSILLMFNSVQDNRDALRNPLYIADDRQSYEFPREITEIISY